MLKVKETNATFTFAFESLPRTGSYLRIINLLHMDSSQLQNRVAHQQDFMGVTLSITMNKIHCLQ